jgi:hypothetical protein
MLSLLVLCLIEEKIGEPKKLELLLLELLGDEKEL